MALISLSKDVDLIYSPDDAAATGKGYYLQRYPDGATSPLYRTQFEAQKAFKHGNIIEWIL